MCGRAQGFGRGQRSAKLACAAMRLLFRRRDAMTGGVDGGKQRPPNMRLHRESHGRADL